ncbi:hypothetical protein OH77DRAFT_335011 [Trametes cingulata]|nr:hypothetical protein OH77DRAFT_335011 [Trametes cingulata]
MGMQPAMMTAGMGLNRPTNMAPLRASMSAAQQPQMPLQMHQQQAQQSVQAGGAMSPNMGIPMSRPAHMQGPGAMPRHARTPSGQAQLMPPEMQLHGMPQQMQHNAFGNPMSLPYQHQHQHQHRQSQFGASQHVATAADCRDESRAGGPRQFDVHELLLEERAAKPTNFPPPVAHGVPRPPMHNPQIQVGFARSPAPPDPGGEVAQRGHPPMASSGATAQGVI